MRNGISIITIGLSPALDITCRGRNINWGLLAGFLKALEDNSSTNSALKTAIKIATARAWGWTEKKTSPQAMQEIKVAVKQI